MGVIIPAIIHNLDTNLTQSIVGIPLVHVIYEHHSILSLSLCKFLNTCRMFGFFADVCTHKDDLLFLCLLGGFLCRFSARCCARRSGGWRRNCTPKLYAWHNACQFFNAMGSTPTTGLSRSTYWAPNSIYIYYGPERWYFYLMHTSW